MHKDKIIEVARLVVGILEEMREDGAKCSKLALPVYAKHGYLSRKP